LGCLRGEAGSSDRSLGVLLRGGHGRSLPPLMIILPAFISFKLR
jgi:hypothetical protein